MDIDVYSIVLGYPWAFNINPNINFRSQKWVYREESPKSEVLSAQEFATVLSDTEENVPLFMAYAQLTRAGVTIAILSTGNTPA